MAYYNDTRNIRELITDQEISHLEYLNKRQKEFENDIIPEIMDTRTKYEKLKDKDYINQQLRTMAYNLFDNDIKYSEKFIQYCKLNNVNYSRFSTIYDDLVKRFKGTDAQPHFVFKTAETLMKNIINTGTTGGYNTNTIVESLNQLKNNLTDYNFNSNYLEQETKNKLNAMIYLYNNIFNDKTNITFYSTSTLTEKEFGTIKKNMSSAVNEIIQNLVRDDISEIDKQENIMRLLGSIKEESIRKITKYLQQRDIMVE